MGMHVLANRVDIDLDAPLQSMVGDGFALDPSIRYLPGRYRSDALTNMEWLRTAVGSYFPRYYVAPLDVATTIASRDTFSLQHRMVPGGFIWGWDIAIIDGVSSLTSLWIQVVDPCARRPVFQSYVNASMLQTTGQRPFVLQDPYKIDGQGLIDVQIRSSSGSAIGVQLVLNVSEPTYAELQAPGDPHGRNTTTAVVRATPSR